jgi:hypothetical protein
VGEVGSQILDSGRSPADWLDVFAAKGLPISERTLRAKARKLGACHVIGKAMIITPGQIDRILEDSLCPSNPIQEAQHGGREARSNITGDPSPATSAKALAHLQRMARKTGSRTGKRGNVVAISSASSTGR